MAFSRSWPDELIDLHRSNVCFVWRIKKKKKNEYLYYFENTCRHLTVPTPVEPLYSIDLRAILTLVFLYIFFIRYAI